MGCRLFFTGKTSSLDIGHTYRQKEIQLRREKMLEKAIAIVVGSILLGIGINVFLVPYELLDGGIIGIGLIIKYIWKCQSRAYDYFAEYSTLRHCLVLLSALFL
jgi:uncharacterized membrane-anchored protein YitT (DUF2179 family)